MCNKNENTSFEFYEFKYLSGNLRKLPHPSQIDVHDSPQNLRILIQKTSYSTVDTRVSQLWRFLTILSLLEKLYLLQYYSQEFCALLWPFICLSICPFYNPQSGIFQDLIIFWNFWIWKDVLHLFVGFFCFGIFCCILKQQIIYLLNNCQS